MSIPVSTAPRPHPAHLDARSFPRKICIHCYAPVAIIEIGGEGVVIVESTPYSQACFLDGMIVGLTPERSDYEPGEGQRLNVKAPGKIWREHSCGGGQPAKGYIIEHGGYDERIEL